MPIKNLSNLRRLPRLGKIQLGIKVKTDKSCRCKHDTADKKPRADCMLCKGTGLLHRPKEVDYFVLPKELQEVFGDQVKELPIMFPVENIEVFFQQWYKCYGFNVLRCKGDGANAMTWDEEEGGMKTIACPCEKLDTGACRRVAILQFLLPDVKGAGVWQISTTSRNSIIDINSSVEYIRGLCGRVRMIPLVLKREEIKTQRLEKGVPKSGRHYTLKIDVANVSLRELQAAGRVRPEEMMLPAPDEEREDLLYPAAGFNGAEKGAEKAMKEESEKKDKEKENEAPKPAEPLPADVEQSGKPAKEEEVIVGKSAFEKARDTLLGRMEDYVKKWGGEISMETAEKVARFTKFDEVSKELDRINAAIEEKKAKEIKKKEKEFAGSDGKIPF